MHRQGQVRALDCKTSLTDEATAVPRKISFEMRKLSLKASFASHLPPSHVNLLITPHNSQNNKMRPKPMHTKYKETTRPAQLWLYQIQREH
jgi:hypothetical protein